MRMQTRNNKPSPATGMRRFKLFILPVVLLLITVVIDADVVCTFIGEGPDIVHNINLKYKSSIRISVPGKELIKRVIYNKRNFKVVNNLHELIVRPKADSLSGYLTIITEENYIYIFKLKTIKTEDKSNHFDRHIIIKR